MENSHKHEHSEDSKAKLDIYVILDEREKGGTGAGS